MKTLRVDLSERSYPIYIGSDLLQQQALLNPYIHHKQIMIVTNKIIAKHYLHTLKTTISPHTCNTVILPDGEKFKTLDTLNLIFTELLKKKFDRKSVLIALGGGVIGDITGFAAACYQRGIAFIQIPTTLLAQVDSSVGGKTAVNHTLGKNMIGAFHQPQCVIADTAVLATLPDRELSAGLAEIIKYGLIRDKSFFDWLQININKLIARDPEALSFAIERSCLNKAQIVALDEKESNIRALLNLGHTFGHAIETYMEYQGWLHGEAIATGIAIAAQVSLMRGWINQIDVKVIIQLLETAGLPTKPPHGMCADLFLELMQRDKKVTDGKIRLILLKQIGESVISDDTDPALLRHCLEIVTQNPS